MVGPSPTRIRERMAAIADPRQRATARAEEVKDTVPDIVQGTSIRRGDLRIEFDAAPQFIMHPVSGEVIGIDALVRVFRGAVELEVDPHRVCINPPTLVPDGTTHTEFTLSGQPYEVDNFEENPRAAYLTWLEQSLRVVPNVGGFRTIGTVTTLFATAPGGVGSVLSSNTVYATARSGGTLSTGGDHQIGQQLDVSDYYCLEGFVVWDTSSIADTDTVSAVVLSMDGLANFSTTDFTMVASAYDFGAALPTTADYVAGASLGALTELGTWASSGYLAGYNAFTSSAGFPGAISKTGNTHAIFFSALQRDNTAPTGNEYVVFTDADSAGTTSDPKLDITHAAAGNTWVAEQPFTSIPMRRRVAAIAY